MTLTIFPRHHRIPFVYRVGGSWQPLAVVAEDKRFTDGELAAEVWCACDERTANASNILIGQHNNPHSQKAFQEAIERVITLHRFAITPHLDEGEQS